MFQPSINWRQLQHASRRGTQARSHVSLMMRLWRGCRSEISRADNRPANQRPAAKSGDDVVESRQNIHRKIQGSPNKSPSPIFPSLPPCSVLRHDSRQKRLNCFIFSYFFFPLILSEAKGRRFLCNTIFSRLFFFSPRYYNAELRSTTLKRAPSAPQMNVFSRSTFATARIGNRTQTWTCSTCRVQLARTKPPRQFIARRFVSGQSSSSHANGGAKSGPNARLILFASTGAAAGTAALAFTDEIKNSYEAAERTGRVVAALAVCINE